MKDWYDVTKINKNLFAIAEFQHHEKVIAYLISGSNSAFLIDTGLGIKKISSVVKNLTKLPVKVLLTHTHWDHIGGVKEFKRINVYNDKFELNKLRRAKVSIDKLFTFENNEIFLDKKISIKAIHTPGHTPGSVCYFVESEGWLFTGDTIYPGPLYAHLKESNLSEYKKSIAKLEKLLLLVKYIFPGHNKFIEKPKLIADISEGLSSIRKSRKNKYKFEKFSILVK